MVELTIIIIVFSYFGLAPLVGHVLYKKLKYSKTKKKNYTGFFLRLIAGIADLIIIIIFLFFFVAIFQALFYDFNQSFVLLEFITSWAYFCFFHSSKYQATPGMMICKIKIYDQKFKRINLGRASIKYFSLPLSGVIFLIGFFMIGFTKRKQGLHDIFAKTLHLNK